MDLGVLLTLPVESVAVRAILATVACVLLARLVLRRGIRTSGVRVFTALAPAAVLLIVVVTVSTQMRLPALMLPVEGIGLLPIPVTDGYQHFAPMAIPVLVGMWGAIALVRLSRRGLAFRAASQRAKHARLVGSQPRRVRAAVGDLAERLDVPTPVVAVVPHCEGGAFVTGRRRPTIVIDGGLLARLDDDELEGVLAHELAHVRRRDNSVSAALGALRDLAFFVPGIGWAARQLHRERELAADQVAVNTTGKPGALASGLLKVIETSSVNSNTCAALAPHGSLVDRVQVLVDDRPAIGRVRRSCEFGAAAAVCAVAVGIGMFVPTALTGPEREREAVALVWSSAAPVQNTMTANGDARAFDVYRNTNVEAAKRQVQRRVPYEENATEYRRSTLHACRSEVAACPTPQGRVGLGIQPQPVIQVDEDLTSLWEAVPMADGDPRSDGFRMFWLSSAR